MSELTAARGIEPAAPPAEQEIISGEWIRVGETLILSASNRPSGTVGLGTWLVKEPLNVDIRTETSRRLGRYKADHRGSTKSGVADAAIAEWLAKRNY